MSNKFPSSCLVSFRFVSFRFAEYRKPLILRPYLPLNSFQTVAHLSKVVEMGEKIGELIVKGLKRGGNITEPKSIQIQTNNLGETTDSFTSLLLYSFYFFSSTVSCV